MLRMHVSALFRNGGNKVSVHITDSKARNKRFDIPVLFNSAVMALKFLMLFCLLYILLYIKTINIYLRRNI